MSKEFEALIIEHMETKRADALSVHEIREGIGMPQKSTKRLRGVISRMVNKGVLTRTGQSSYLLAAKKVTLEGRLSLVRSGKGFVNCGPDTKDVFIPQYATQNALPGDRVSIEISEKELKSDRPEGRILRVVSRERRDLVGTLRHDRRAWFVLPLDPAYPHSYVVNQRKGGQDGDRVVIRIGDWSADATEQTAEILDVIGPSDNPSLDTLTIMRLHGYEDGFPEDVVAEAQTAAFQADDSRLDLREKRIITIDPLRAKDFDDALSLEEDSDGNRVLGVHIADVSYYVAPGTALDAEAYRRGNSVYLPDKVIPMLPEQLSNGICSLRPNEDRLAFTAYLTFNSTGQVLKTDFKRTVIRSCLRLTYEEAMVAITAREKKTAKPDDLSDENFSLISRLHELALQLRRQRFKKFALELDIPEFDVVMGDDDMIQDIVLSVHDDSHKLVEECMVAANEAVDQYLSSRNLPVIHRLHTPPRPDKLVELSAKLIEMGFESPGDLSNRKHLAQFITSITDHPLAREVYIMILRSMNRAEYNAREGGHYGLSKVFYAHFTSPIRRYADLVVHRILGAHIAKKKPLPYETRDLDSVCQNICLTEQEAESAERELIEIKKYRFLDQQIKMQSPIEYEAVITRLSNFGFFVDLIQLQLSGLVHNSSLGGRPDGPGRPRHRKKKGALRANKQTFELGQKVTVYAVKVNFDERKIDFALVSESTEDSDSG